MLHLQVAQFFPENPIFSKKSLFLINIRFLYSRYAQSVMHFVYCVYAFKIKASENSYHVHSDFHIWQQLLLDVVKETKISGWACGILSRSFPIYCTIRDTSHVKIWRRQDFNIL